MHRCLDRRLLTPTMRKRIAVMCAIKRLAFVMLLSLACVGCDHITKALAVSVLPADHPLSYLGGTIRLQLVHNRGAFLSMGAFLPERWRFYVFGIGSSCFLLVLLIYGLFAKGRSQSRLWGIALIFAGGAGNLLDRFFHDGIVVDFINIGIGPVRTGIFNVADMAITAGACIFFWTAFRQSQKG